MNARSRAETGMALIHVGIAVVLLMALSSIVIDCCLFPTLGQAQNAADARGPVCTSTPAAAPAGVRM
jgi:hypothetical protein